LALLADFLHRLVAAIRAGIASDRGNGLAAREALIPGLAVAVALGIVAATGRAVPNGLKHLLLVSLSLQCLGQRPHGSAGFAEGSREVAGGKALRPLGLVRVASHVVGVPLLVCDVLPQGCNGTNQLVQ